MYKSNLFVLFILILVLTACQSGEVSPSPSPPSEESTRTPPPTAEPTEITLPTATDSPTPSETSVPSPTSLSTTGTPDWMEYDIDAWMSTSPDGLWVTKIVVAYPPEDASGNYANDKYHIQVNVHSADDMSTGWMVVDEWLNIGLGMTTPTVLRWTEDGPSLFIADTGVPDGCGPRFIMNVRRVDLQSGQVAVLGDELFGELSVSPDGGTLVAFSSRIGLMVHDLSSGEVREITFTHPEGDWWPGEVVWSPEGREFLFGLSTSPCFAPEEVTSSIWLASLESGEARPLIQNDPNRYSIESWPTDCVAQISDNDGVWWLNPCTGELSQTPPAEVIQARDALIGFFEALHQGIYGEATEFYGGSYDVLQDMNPSLDPDNYEALWSNACQSNGFVCLSVGSYVLESQKDQDELRFSVTFNQGGETFILGPCCGASIIDQPPVSWFTYTLIQDTAGVYRVQDLPVYMP